MTTPMTNIRVPVALRDILRERLERLNTLREPGKELTYSQFLEFVFTQPMELEALRSFKPKLSAKRGRPRLSEAERKERYYLKHGRYPKAPDLPKRDW